MFTNLAIVWGPHFAEMGGRRNTPWFGEVCGIGFRTLGGSPTKVPLRKKLWKSKLSDPFLWQNHGIRENLWKSQGKTSGNPTIMGNPWENHGKTMGKPWETEDPFVWQRNFRHREFLIYPAGDLVQVCSSNMEAGLRGLQGGWSHSDVNVGL